MKKLIFIALLAFSLGANAQTKKDSLVADQTFIHHSPKSFKLCTANDKIFEMLLKRFPSIDRYTTVLKLDRSGNYWQREVSFKPEELKDVETFFKSL